MPKKWPNRTKPVIFLTCCLALSHCQSIIATLSQLSFEKALFRIAADCLQKAGGKVSLA
jgi:hypothetical protein